jgi:signal transduction histidine kinase
MGERFGIQAEFEADPLRLAGTVETALYRVIHEALSNVAKHSRATTVRVALRQEHERLIVVVEDNGVGFTPGSMRTNPREGGVGMISMRRRTELLQGRFDVQSAPDQGTTVRLSLPLALVTGER